MITVCTLLPCIQEQRGSIGSEKMWRSVEMEVTYHQIDSLNANPSGKLAVLMDGVKGALLEHFCCFLAKNCTEILLSTLY